MIYFQLFMVEATQDKRVVQVEMPNYIDDMTPDDLSIKYFSGDGGGELKCFAKVQGMLANRGIKWRFSLPCRPQRNGINERAIQQRTMIARSQLVKAGHGEDYWFFAVADAAFFAQEMLHGYLGGRDAIRTFRTEAVQLRSSSGVEK